MGEDIIEKDVPWITSPERGLLGGSGSVSCFTLETTARLPERCCSPSRGLVT